jgi:hypothetical protein
MARAHCRHSIPAPRHSSTRPSPACGTGSELAAPAVGCATRAGEEGIGANPAASQWRRKDTGTTFARGQQGWTRHAPDPGLRRSRRCKSSAQWQPVRSCATRSASTTSSCCTRCAPPRAADRRCAQLSPAAIAGMAFDAALPSVPPASRGRPDRLRPSGARPATLGVHASTAHPVRHDRCRHRGRRRRQRRFAQAPARAGWRARSRLPLHRRPRRQSRVAGRHLAAGGRAHGSNSTSAPARPVRPAAPTVFVLLADGSTWQMAPCPAPDTHRLAAASPAPSGLTVAAGAHGGHLAWVLSACGHQYRRNAARAAHRRSPTVRSSPPTSPAETENPEFGTLVIARPCGRASCSCACACAAISHTAARPAGAALRRTRYRTRPRRPGRVLDRSGSAPCCSSARMQYKPERPRLRLSRWIPSTTRRRWGRSRSSKPASHPAPRSRFRAFSRDELDLVDPIDGLGASSDTPALSQHVWDSYAGEPQALFRDPSQRPLSPAPAEGFAAISMRPCHRRSRAATCGWCSNSHGARSKSPRLRSASVEYPGHDLLSKTAAHAVARAGERAISCSAT